MSQITYEWIREIAKENGFSDCGVTPISPLSEEGKRLDEWLKSSYHSGMDYMANHRDKRTNADLLVEGAKSVISVMLNYYNDLPEPRPRQAIFSKYALGRDYHKVLKKKLKAFFNQLQERFPDLQGRYFSDSAPVMEKAWLVRSGLGWRGKNGNIISREHGSFFFIGEIISNLDIEIDNQLSKNYCGSCTRCIDACPTDAIIQPSVLDAQRCISYQTIENKSPIPEEFIPKIGHRIFGCDICQDVCPWNKKVKITSCADFQPRSSITDLDLEDVLLLSEEEFDRRFNGTAVRRAGREKLSQTAAQIINAEKEK